MAEGDGEVEDDVAPSPVETPSASAPVAVTAEPDRATRIAIHCFLYVVSAFFIFLLVGSAVEFYLGDMYQTEYEVFDLLLRVSDVYVGHAVAAINALLAVIGLYFAKNVSNFSWSLITASAFISMFASFLVGLEVLATGFDVGICDFTYVGQVMVEKGQSHIACEDWNGRDGMYGDLSSFVIAAFAANFSIFFAFLNRNASHPFIKQIWKKLGGSPDGASDE